MNSAVRTSVDVPAGTSLPEIAMLDNDELQSEIRGLAGNAAALMCRLLLLVAELDRRGAGWSGALTLVLIGSHGSAASRLAPHESMSVWHVHWRICLALFIFSRLVS